VTIERESIMSPEPIPAPRPRRPPPLDEDIPRHWFAGHALATHVVNGVNLLFPAGERFFVRSVRHFLDEVEDPVLRAQVRGFAGQEGWHAQAHEAFFRVLEAQGYRLERFMSLYQRIAFQVVERAAPPKLRLAVTAAAEHFTATLAEAALRDRILDLAHPALQDLLLWHAAEEIEHKHVAFDVLRLVDDRYALRMAGLVMATVLLAGFWLAATTMLLRQDGLGLSRIRRELGDFDRREGVIKRVFLGGIRDYLRRDFHPAQHDNYDLARTYLEGRDMTPAEPAPLPA
jgi:predicted metal-dependent hydrolase